MAVLSLFQPPPSPRQRPRRYVTTTTTPTLSDNHHPTSLTSSSLDRIPLQEWSLDRLANTTRNYNNSDDQGGTGKEEEEEEEEVISKIILDVACRLHRQVQLLQSIQHTIQEDLRRHITVLIRSNNCNSRSKILAPDTNTNNGGGTQQQQQQRHSLSRQRPYWWTYQQEQQLQDEFDKALRSLQDLKRLHQDTLQQTLQYYQQWRINNTTMTTNYNAHSVLHSSTAVWKAMTKTFQEVQARHAMTVETMAEIVIGVLHPLQHSPQITHDMDVFLQSRCMIQLLCDHLVAVGKQQQQQADGGKKKSLSRNGAVTKDHSVHSVVEAAVYEAGHLCEAHFLARPPVEAAHSIRESSIDDDNGDGVVKRSSTDTTTKATFIRPWLQYTLVELLKNAMAATIENPNPQCMGQLRCRVANREEEDEDEETIVTKEHCPLFIYISETDAHVTIQIMDQGGGLSQSNTSVDNVFEFAQCSEKWDRLDDQQTYAMVRSPMRGLGVGLAMSRLQMRQFGGDVVLQHRSSAGDVQVQATDNDGKIQWYPLEAGVTATVVLQKG